jgi:hypothetical protein
VDPPFLGRARWVHGRGEPLSSRHSLSNFVNETYSLTLEGVDLLWSTEPRVPRF